MIILATNVVSEPLKPKADPKIIDWLDEQAAETLFLTSVNLAELLTGVAVLPDGKRKDLLSTNLSTLLDQLFGNRILPFDAAAAREFALITSMARDKGQGLSIADSQIAAIAKTHGFMVATRDTAPFEAAGVALINPWEI